MGCVVLCCISSGVVIWVRRGCNVRNIVLVLVVAVLLMVLVILTSLVVTCVLLVMTLLFRMNRVWKVRVVCSF